MGVVPQDVVAANLDETPHALEAPRLYAQRIAREKAQFVWNEQHKNHKSCIVLSADTVVAVGRRILPKAETDDDALACLDLLSGRTHRVYTAICGMDATQKMRTKVVESRVTFKRLSALDIEYYIQSNEWKGKAGGYAIQGFAGCFVSRIVGSYSAIVGLPLYESAQMLKSCGYENIP